MLKQHLLSKHRWLVFVLPFLVYMLLGALEPAPAGAAGKTRILPFASASYPLLYTLKIALTLCAIALVWPGYRQFPWRLSPWAILVGAAGAVVWIGLCYVGLGLESWLSKVLPAGWPASLGARAAYNPFVQLAGRPLLAWGFLGVRFLGLVAVVPLIEEFFLRGFLMRLVIQPEWWEVPFGKLTWPAVLVGVGVPVLYHCVPTETLAAVAWFGLVTWLMAKTRNIWDCVAAHAVTNLLLGVYVLAVGKWWLW
ncbi:MAG: CAAX prenyl protease-related protein [Thermoguttaceae bacterium]